MLGPRNRLVLLIAAVSAVAGSAPSFAQTPDQPKLPSRVSFQSEMLRHRREDPLPASVTRKDEPRALWLARLAAEGRRPLRLAWKPESETSQMAADPFARLTLDLQGTATELPLHIAEPERWTRVMEALTASATCACTHWGAIPGAVPGDGGLHGSLLHIGKSGANVTLSWGASCSDSATDYSVHRGTIGSWYSHQALACTTGGVTSTTLAPGAASSYFLIVPITADAEGSYGANSAGVQRPSSSVACRSVWVTETCP